MRTCIILTLLISITCTASAQTNVGDSIQYYDIMAAKYQRRILDSIRDSDSSQLIAARLKNLKRQSRSYFAFILFGEAAGTDFSTFNAAIAKDGFQSFTGPVWRFGLGFSYKAYSGVMIDFNYAILGIDRHQKKGSDEISTNFSNLFEFELGYAVVNTKRFDIYPYAGFSLQMGALSYSSPAVVNNNYNSIASFITNNQSASGNTYNLGYEAGLGIDYAFHVNKNNSGGTMLFAKFGTDGSLGSDTYKIANVNYNSGIKYGVWIAELGFKFFKR